MKKTTQAKEQRNKEIQEARAEFKKRPLGFFVDLIKEEYNSLGWKKWTWYFVSRLALVFGIMFLIGTVNNDVRYCEFTGHDGFVKYEGPFNEGMDYYRAHIEEVQFKVTFANAIEPKDVWDINCTYDIPRWWEEQTNE